MWRKKFACILSTSIFSRWNESNSRLGACARFLGCIAINSIKYSLSLPQTEPIIVLQDFLARSNGWCDHIWVQRLRAYRTSRSIVLYTCSGLPSEMLNVCFLRTYNELENGYTETKMLASLLSWITEEHRRRIPKVEKCSHWMIIPNLRVQE